jgi:hypothetical protein
MAPFFRYLVVDMERELVVEAGVPTATPVDDDGDVVGGVLPSGQYAAVTQVGRPDELIDVTADLPAWAEDRGLRWDMVETSAGPRWGCRLEVLRRIRPNSPTWPSGTPSWCSVSPIRS